MHKPRISAPAFARLVGVSWALLFLVVLTGAAVRLTDSGLGCEDWPTCDDDRIIEEWSYHASIEFGNRLATGFVGLVCVATAVAAHFRSKRRRDLIAWSWAVVGGVMVQAIIGRYSVTTHLHPLVVALHFLGSPVLLWMVIVLWVRATSGPVRQTAGAPPQPVWHARAVLALAALVLAVGTLVTGTGPNGGDSRADRLDFDFATIARMHSVSVWIFLAVLVWLVLRIARRPEAAERSFRLYRWLIGVCVAQGAVGYYQYGNGVPPAVVEAHIFGATVLWCLAVLGYLSLFDASRSR